MPGVLAHNELFGNVRIGGFRRSVETVLRRFYHRHRVSVRVHIHISGNVASVRKHGIRVAQLGRRIFSLFGAHPAAGSGVSRLDLPGSVPVELFHGFARVAENPVVPAQLSEPFLAIKLLV